MDNGPPPPPPPHGEGIPKSSGLPPGNYDIFIIPPHSSGGGFVYLPSLKPNANSFAAGLAVGIILCVMVSTITPAAQSWWANMKGSGGGLFFLLVIGVALGAWAIGRIQTDGRPGPGGGERGSGPSAGAHAHAHANGNGYAHGAAPGPQPGPQHGHQSGPGPTPGAGAGWQRPNPTPGATGATGATGANTHNNTNAKPNPSAPNSSAKGAWEKAREETKRKEEERKAKEADKKRKEDLEKKLKEMREKDAREREAREKAAREKTEREAREARLKEARLKEANLKEANLREANLREANLREANLREANLREANLKEANLREANLREARLKEVNLREARLREAKLREARLREAKLQEAKLQEAKLQEAKLQEAKLQEAKLRAEKEEPKGSTYAFSAVGEKTNPWPRGRPASPAARSQPPSPVKRPPAPTAKTYLGTEEDTYSFRPYDKPKKPMRKKSLSSLYSESSYAASHSTSQTSPPPSNRGPYSTKDPDKIVIKAVYSFNNAFLKTPTSQLVSGVGSVTDGLILRITTEGLFIDDDVRGVPQREWDVKAWTMKLVEVWCPSFRQGPAGKSSPSARVANSGSPVKHNPVRRLWGLDKEKPATSEETDALLVEMAQLCRVNCRTRAPSFAASTSSSAYSASSVASSVDDRSESSFASSYASSAGSSSPSWDKRRTDNRGAHQTGEYKSARLHVLRASIRDQEGKKWLFVIPEEESWKVAVGLQKLRKSMQVRALGVSGMSANDARTTLENLGWG